MAARKRAPSGSRGPSSRGSRGPSSRGSRGPPSRGEPPAEGEREARRARAQAARSWLLGSAA
eukprot:3673304-Prymnesium_polylepis.1